MKKIILLLGISMILPLFLSACDDDYYCYREGIYIYNADDEEISYCQEGKWRFYNKTDLESACLFICSDEESQKANHEWCQTDCLDYLHTTGY
ncbi:MAG: hypothetical protein IJU23_08235 [Proteobacteria bacterium]|nr:hypothetical protein [Pseudomonadota bacterium]